MSKQTGPTPEFIEAPMNETVLAANTDARQQLAVITLQDQVDLSYMAQQLGYEGSLTVGAIEDEIRFYQKRTVECLLETGKRLLLLKQMTQHGDFAQRVELLGFSYPTANRFMQAAQKVSKSLKLRDLASHSKNGSAFLELITHDDGVIDNLAEMDGFDRMSASQLRANAREMLAEKDATEKLLATKDATINTLSRRIDNAPPEEQLALVLAEVTKRAHTAIAYVRGDLDTAFGTLAGFEKAGSNSHRHLMAGWLGDLEREIAILRADYFLPMPTPPAGSAPSSAE